MHLPSLSNWAKNQLVLLIAQRDVVAYGNQLDFIDAGPGAYTEWGGYFGRLAFVLSISSGVPESIMFYIDLISTRLLATSRASLHFVDPFFN